jgi:hypothetical protein
MIIGIRRLGPVETSTQSLRLYDMNIMEILMTVLKGEIDHRVYASS